MTGPLPPMATFSELLATAVRAATVLVSDGSVRNAREALDARAELARQGAETLAAVPARPAPDAITST